MKIKTNNGFTLIEVLIIIIISAIILLVVTNSFGSLARTQALDKDFNSIVSIIEQAKSQAINSKSESQYGVKFSTSTVTLFKGGSYNSSSTSNVIYSLNNRVYVSAINLVGSSTDQIIFDRMTGYSNASGTISVSLYYNNPPTTRIVQVYRTGIIENK